MSREYPKTPQVGIGAVVWKDDRVLMIKRAKPPAMGAWSLPGGGLEVGETLFGGAAREVLEETGVTCEPVCILTAIDGITRDAAGRAQWHYVIVDVVADYVSGDAVAGDDSLEARWMSLAEVDDHAYSDAIRQVVRLAKLRRERLDEEQAVIDSAPRREPVAPT